MNPKTLLVLLGRNGSGKTKIISGLRESGVTFSMSDILKEAKTTNPHFGHIIREHMEVRKDNVPCEIVSEIFLNHFTQIAPETDELIVYEGACRSGLQVRLKLRKLRELYPELRIVICFLEVDHKEALRRIAGRRAEDLKNTGKSRPEDEPVYAEKRSNTYSDLLPDIFEATHEFGPDRIIFLNYNSKTPEDGVGEILSHLCEIGALAA